MSVFLLACWLLTPLAWIVLNGPHLALLEVVVGMSALAWLAAKGQVFALLRLIPFLCAGFLYAFTAYVANDRPDLVMYSYQTALLLLFYGLPAGLCLRRLAQGEGSGVGCALLVLAIGMAAISLLILRLPEVQRITGEVTGSFQRTNGEEDTIVYLRFFSITNIIIGVIPFTIFGLAALPLALVTPYLGLRVLAVTAVGVAAFANILIATRTALLAAICSSVVVLILALPTVPARRWLISLGVVMIPGVVAVAYFGGETERFNYLLSRFAEAGNDGRLGIWAEGWALLQRHPGGQAAASLQSHSWAHNLFLDVGITHGWVAVVAVLAMFVYAYYQVARRLLGGGFFASAANPLMLGWLIATSFAGMMQPPQPVFLAVLHLAAGYFAPVRRSAPPLAAGEGYFSSGALLRVQS